MPHQKHSTTMEFDELINQIKSRIGQVVAGTIDDLTDIWLETFGADNTRDNLDKLVGHAQTFMNEICEETVDRKQAIQDRVTELHTERQRLRNLLQLQPPATGDDSALAVPLFHYQVLLDQQNQTLRDQLAERHAHIRTLCQRELAVCTAIGEPARGLPLEPLPSADDLESFELRLEELRAEQATRSRRCARLRESVLALCAAMAIEVPRNDARAVLVHAADAPLSLHNLGRLETFVVALRERKAALRSEIRAMQKQLHGLYERLEFGALERLVELPAHGDDVADDETDATENDEDETPSGGYTKAVVDRLRVEIERCERIKRQNIQKFVEALRRRIVEMWERTMRSDTERARFTFFTSDMYNEDMLQLHELELADLERFHEDNALLFQRIEEHRTLWQRLLALEAKEKEPGRYKNRGGQLLIEEKERRAIATKVPKILAEITGLVEAYSERNPTRPFTIWGQPVEEHIASMHEERTANKEQQMSARKAATATPRTGAAAAGLGVSSVQRSMMTSSRTPASAVRSAAATSGAASLKRMASVTNINSVTSTKKLRIHTVSSSTAGATPARPINRNILGELAQKATLAGSAKKPAASTTLQRTPGAGATPAKLAPPHRFVRPAGKANGSATTTTTTTAHAIGRVVDTLANNNRRRSRRKSHNKSSSKSRAAQPRIVVSDCTSNDSYSLFEERVQPNQRSSMMLAESAPPARKPAAAAQGAGHTPAKIRRRSRSPSTAIVASPSRLRTPSPSLAKLSSRNLPYLF